MGAATFVEKFHGRGAVGEYVYGSWWFVALWGLLAIAGIVLLVRMGVHRRAPVFLLHLAWVVMLAGALISHLTSQEGMVHLRMDRGATSFVDSRQRLQRLPFTMQLEDFSILCYPGTDAAMDYRSEIRICNDDDNDDHDDECRTLVVSMNRVGKAAGYRFYQASYDDDCRGTYLLVAHDPYGIAVTYAGYLMLLVSLLWTAFSRHTRIRELYRVATRPLVVMLSPYVLKFLSSSGGLMLLLLAVFGLPLTSAWGQTPARVSSSMAHELGRVVVLYNGRLCPINTAATDFVTKLSGRASWRGYSADEIFTGWMVSHTEWEQQQIIRIKSAEVQRLLGIEGQWASVRDFYTAEGEYKLRVYLAATGDAQPGGARVAATPSQSGRADGPHLSQATRKAIREADEKLQVVSMFYSNEMLRMFPLEVKPQRSARSDTRPRASTIVWHSPGSTVRPHGIPERELQFINHTTNRLVQSILADDVSGARQMIARIKLYQQEKVGDALPSKAMIGLEVCYNTLLSARWATFLCLTLSLLFCLLLLSERGGRAVRRLDTLFIMSQLTFLSVLFALRWLISGHIPMSNGYETMLFMALTTLLITVLTLRRIPILRAFGPVVASFCMLVAALASGSPQVTSLTPVLQSPLLALHVAMVMIAYALLAMITLLAIHGLYLAYSMATSYVDKPSHKAALSLHRTTALSQLLLYPAVFTLRIGIFVGAVWANVSWGTYWSWDPKETWALITLMIYAIPLHRSFMPSSPARYHLFVLISFLTVLMTYFGVNYILPGMHSYA